MKVLKRCVRNIILSDMINYYITTLFVGQPRLHRLCQKLITIDNGFCTCTSTEVIIVKRNPKLNIQFLKLCKSFHSSQPCVFMASITKNANKIICYMLLKCQAFGTYQQYKQPCIILSIGRNVCQSVCLSSRPSKCLQHHQQHWCKLFWTGVNLLL